MLFLIRLFFFAWGFGLIGAGVMVKNPGLCADYGRSVFGVNMIQIGIVVTVLMVVWHFAAKAPAGTKFGGRLIFAFKQLLGFVKQIWVDWLAFWNSVPTKPAS